VELLVGLFLFAISFILNYEKIFREIIARFFDRYDIFLVISASALQLLITIFIFFQWHSEEYRLKEKEIIHKRGLFFKKENSILLKNISSVEYKRGPLEFFLNYATLIIHTRAGEKPIKISSVENAEIYSDVIRDTMDIAITGKPKSNSKKHSILDMILEGENQYLEFKQTFRWDIKQKVTSKDLEKSVIKTISAFLNSDGGNLLIGVADNGSVCGINDDIKTLVKKDKDGFENHFNQVLRTSIGAEFRQYVNLIFETIEDKDVCFIEVTPSPKPVYVKTNGEEEFFIRTGNSTSPLKVSEANSYIESHWEK